MYLYKAFAFLFLISCLFLFLILYLFLFLIYICVILHFKSHIILYNLCQFLPFSYFSIIVLCINFLPVNLFLILFLKNLNFLYFFKFYYLYQGNALHITEVVKRISIMQKEITSAEEAIKLGNEVEG